MFSVFRFTGIFLNQTLNFGPDDGSGVTKVIRVHPLETLNVLRLSLLLETHQVGYCS